MSYKHIDVTATDHVTRLTLNRPAVLNAINQKMHDELQRAFDQFAGDDDQYLCVIRGAGDRAFSAGYDPKWQAEHGEEAFNEGLRSLKGKFGGITERFDCFKPIIAAVNGFALGGGLRL